MLKKLLKMRANIWLTTGIIIVITGLFFTSVIILSNIDPLSADAKLQEDPIDRGGEYPVTGIGNYGNARSDYTYTNTSVKETRSIITNFFNWWYGVGNSSTAQPRVNNPYPGVDPTTGRW